MKAVLVIDMPENCNVCDLSNEVHGYHENCLNHEFYETDKVFYKRPSWCPLRPLPHKMTDEEERVKDPYNEELFYDLYMSGWNDCLKKITGEME